jgi:hypothetical protein
MNKTDHPGYFAAFPICKICNNKDGFMGKGLTDPVYPDRKLYLKKRGRSKPLFIPFQRLYSHFAIHILLLIKSVPFVSANQF